MGQTLFSRAHPSSQDVLDRNKATLGLACEKNPRPAKAGPGFLERSRAGTEQAI